MAKEKTVAVICEYNPFHNGHAYHLERIRENGVDCIIAVMSGNFTQRGEAALISKYERAKAAVLCGADIAVELPFPFCCSYADAFAGAGVFIASRLGCEELCFGSECGDVETLSKIADISDSAEFTSKISELEEAKKSTSYYSLLEKMSGISHISPNDILAIKYIGAIKRLNAGIKPVAVKRIGAGYNDVNVSDEKFLSAAAIRKLILDRDDFEKFLPKASYNIIRENIDSFAYIHNLERAILCHFRLTPPECHADVADMPSGFAKRIRDCALMSSDTEEMISKLCDVSMTKARVRRLMLFCLCGVKNSDLDFEKRIKYVNLLAANDKGRRFLSSRRKYIQDFIVTKPADAKLFEDSADGIEKAPSRQFELGVLSDALYSLSFKNVKPYSDIPKMSPFII